MEAFYFFNCIIMQNIPQIGGTLRPNSSRKLFRLPTDTTALIATWMWVNSTFGVPVRMLSYLLPIIYATQRLKSTGAQIYIADGAAIRLGQSSSIVDENVEIMKSSIEAFIKEFFPDISPRVTLQEETSFVSDISAIEARRKLVENMVNILLKKADTAIMRFADNRKNGWSIRVPLQYMAEHTLYMRDPVVDDPAMFIIQKPLWFEESPMIMIGWPAEEIFYKTRLTILKALGKTEWDNQQLFTGVGRLTPYYSAYDEPLIGNKNIPTDIHDFFRSVSPAFEYDYVTLFLSLAWSQDFSLLSRLWKGIQEEDYPMLQLGLDKLLYFLKQL